MEDQILELAKEITGVTNDDEAALFAFWVVVGNKYVDMIQGGNDRETTIETSVQALEENMS